jgi:hypothetical protein
MNTFLDGKTETDADQIRFFPQTDAERGKLQKIIPHDQVVNLTGRWDEKGMLQLKVATAPPAGETAEQTAARTAEEQEVARLSALTDADLQTLAAENKVKWDDKASRGTMVLKLAAATLKAKAAAEAK